MVKQVNTNPVIFNPTAKTLDFSAWNSFDIRRLMAVINDSRNVLIYAIANNGIGLIKEFSTNTLIKLQCDTTNHAPNDILTVLYDEALQFEITNFSLSLPPNASTETKQDILNNKIVICDTSDVEITSSVLPTGASTSAKQPAIGVSGTSSTDVLTVQGIAGMVAIKVDGSAITQPISTVSLPLPTGAATSALQTTANTSLDSIDTKIPAKGQALTTDSLPVVLPLSQITALTPPTTVNANITNLGQQTSNNSIPVVLANNQTALPITSGNYAQIVDDQATYIYIGNAIVGSLSSSSVWSIKKITFIGSLIKTEWASSTDLFNKIWDDRSTYTYS